MACREVAGAVEVVVVGGGGGGGGGEGGGGGVQDEEKVWGGVYARVRACACTCMRLCSCVQARARTILRAAQPHGLNTTTHVEDVVVHGQAGKVEELVKSRWEGCELVEAGIDGRQAVQ